MTDIIIVNWNSGDYLYNCVQSLLGKKNESLIDKIFIVDNNSSDNSLEKINPNTKIEIIQNRINNGFAKACNQGFRLCKSQYVLLLNPDAQLYETTLNDCISFIDSRYEIDILGCQLLNDEGNITCSCSRFPKAIRFFYDAIGLSKIAPRIFHPALLMTDWDHQQSRKVDQVMGAFMFMKRNIFERIGFFDEHFFVYYEELDFSKRLAHSGGITFYNSQIKAIHSGEGTTSNVKDFRLYLNLRSRLVYAKKHFTLTGYLFVWMCTFLIEPFTRSFFLLFKGNFKKIVQVYKGYKLLIKTKN